MATVMSTGTLEAPAYEGPARPVAGPGAWTGDLLESDRGWVETLDDADRAEVLAAFESVRGRPIERIGAADFEVPGLATRLARVKHGLENGRGIALLRGIPVEGLSDEDAATLCWGIGTRFAPAVVQNRNCDRIWRVRDDAAGKYQIHDPNAPRPGGDAPLSSYAKARSNGPLRFHTDGVDLLSLLCVRSAARGGTSKLASSVTVHDEILARRPELHALLCQDYHRMYESNDEGIDGRYYALPVFTRVGDHFSSQYSRTYVEEAQRAGAPAMTPEQDEALDLLAAVAEETCLRVHLEPGDLLFVNNHTVYHGREPFDDDAGAARDRLLLRLWYSPENSRPLSPRYLGVWNSVEPGALRGSRQHFDTTRG